MRVLLLGGTGSIGSAILEDLVAHDHHILALCRSDLAAQKVEVSGAQPLPGDLNFPESWIDEVAEVDAVIQAAATFASDMGETDARVLQSITKRASTRTTPLRLIYTGGCWLYGETGACVADENTPFDPLPSFAWMAENWSVLSRADHIEAMLLHPGMVYDENDGVLHRYSDAAAKGKSIEIWGSKEATWPMVHRADLAAAYRHVLERGTPGDSYCVAAEEGIATGKLADAVAARHGSSAPHKLLPVSEAVARHGDWAAGPALKQRMSGAKIRQKLGWQPQFESAISMLHGETT